MHDWQFWLTLIVSILALLVALKAINEAKLATEHAKQSQTRNERNQFYPPLEFTVIVADGQVRFSVKNESTTRDTTLERIKFFALTEVGNLNANDEYEFKINQTLSPNESKEFSCQKFDRYLEDFKLMMFSINAKRSNILIRAWLDSKPALYECDTVAEHLEATVSHDGNESFIIRLAN